MARIDVHIKPIPMLFLWLPDEICQFLAAWACLFQHFLHGVLGFDAWGGMVEHWRAYGIVFVFVGRSVVHATQNREMFPRTLYISLAVIILYTEGTLCSVRFYLGWLAMDIERSTLREFPPPFRSVTTWSLRFPGAIEIRDEIHRRPFWHIGWCIWVHYVNEEVKAEGPSQVMMLKKSVVSWPYTKSATEPEVGTWSKVSWIRLGTMNNDRNLSLHSQQVEDSRYITPDKFVNTLKRKICEERWDKCLGSRVSSRCWWW